MAAALVALVGCEQQSQSLPFDVAASVTRTVGGQGGTVSTPAGASVSFPSGSVSGSVEVSVSATDAPSEVRAEGTPATEAFRLEPVGTSLSKPAELELRLSDSDPHAWLATVVSSVNGVVRNYASTRVDLATGLVSAGIDQLGVVAAVIPPASAVFPVESRRAAALMPVARSSTSLSVEQVVVACGNPGTPCSGLTVTATQNLLDLVEEAAVVYPSIAGGFDVNGGDVSGSIAASASLRIKLESGQTSESVEVNAVLEPTAGTQVTETATDVIFTNVLHRISGATDSESATEEEVTTLVVPKSGAGGVVTIDRTFEIRNEDGDLEPARVTLTFPVSIN